MNLTTLLLLSLAVYRLSILVSQDDGPFDVCWRLRDYVKRQYQRQDVTIKDDYQYRGFYSMIGASHGTTDSWQFRGVSCPLCVSFWLSLAVALAWYIAPTFTIAACVPFALSAVTVVIEKRSNNASE